MSLLQVRNLTKTFAGLVAVNQCTFSVEQGKITALIGPNGAGKSTTFDLISGLGRPDRGAVIFDGQDITGVRPHRITKRGIGRTFQLTRDLSEMTVLENLIVQSPVRRPLDLLKRSLLKDEEDRAMELLQFVGMERFRDMEAGRLVQQDELGFDHEDGSELHQLLLAE